MRNFILGYIVGSFLTSFALSYMESYAKAIQQEAIKSAHNPEKVETNKVDFAFSA
jgi:hypothetical protein